jgi:hypothetical protein
MADLEDRAFTLWITPGQASSALIVEVLDALSGYVHALNGGWLHYRESIPDPLNQKIVIIATPTIALTPTQAKLLLDLFQKSVVILIEPYLN